MRDIKFRGKAIRTKKWVYGYYWTNKNGNHFIRAIINLAGCFTIEDIEVIPDTVGQYTGLKDKNEKEIYEGDIVKEVFYKYSNDENRHKGFYENISKVVYKGRAFKYEWIKTNEIKMPEDFKESFIEVIGNIYDNPELLKEV